MEEIGVWGPTSLLIDGFLDREVLAAVWERGILGAFLFFLFLFLFLFFESGHQVDCGFLLPSTKLTPGHVLLRSSNLGKLSASRDRCRNNRLPQILGSWPSRPAG